MKRALDRRDFLRIAGVSLGAGALWRFSPGRALAREIARATGEAPAPFLFAQLSDTHVGFVGPPNPLGTAAFERAAAVLDHLPRRPDLVLFTGDLTHDAEGKDERVRRMRRFQEIARGIRVPEIRMVPGEHDAGIDGGALYREVFGDTSYAFDHRGVHFVALDNVSRARPEVGPERIAWLRRDLARFPPSTPIVVFTHRPLFDLKPEWEWFTSDGDEVMSLLSGFDNVTVLYGHIHREDTHVAGHVAHHAARSLVFAFPDPSAPEKKPLPFDRERPFRNLGLRLVHTGAGVASRSYGIGIEEVELTMRELSGTEGFQQWLRASPE
jgi:3',5'-cyclic AMP phosphodiesterase CpdA